MKTWRAWPWTIALSVVLAGFTLLGLVGLGSRTTVVEAAISLVVTLAAVAGLLRVLTMGVRATPSGLIIRDLTRTTLVPWDRVRRVWCRQTDRRRVFAPVLTLAGAVKGGRRGGAASEDLEITVLGSYRESVAQRRADEIAAMRTTVARRTR